MTDDIKAIRDALAAGPTPGPWIDDRHPNAVWPWTEVKAPDHPGRGVVAHVRLSDVASFSCTIGKAEQEWINAAYIAACHPERIARLLDALEQAQKEAARWRWLREHLSGDGPMISEAMRVIDQEYGWELDPAIDAALKRGA